MRVQVVGIEDQNFTIKRQDGSSYHFDGLTVHCLDLQTVKDDKQQGYLTAAYKIDRTSPIVAIPKVGEVYDVFFDPRGKKIDYMKPVDDDTNGKEE